MNVCVVSQTSDEVELKFEVCDTGVGIPREKQEIYLTRSLRRIRLQHVNMEARDWDWRLPANLSR